MNCRFVQNRNYHETDKIRRFRLCYTGFWHRSAWYIFTNISKEHNVSTFGIEF